MEVEKFKFPTSQLMVKKIKVVKPQSKGMVTIPVEFREKLGIDENSLLEAKLVKNGVMFVKIEYGTKAKMPPIELYADKQIAEWKKEDKLDDKTIKKLEKLLKK